MIVKRNVLFSLSDFSNCNLTENDLNATLEATMHEIIRDIIKDSPITKEEADDISYAYRTGNLDEFREAMDKKINDVADKILSQDWIIPVDDTAKIIVKKDESRNEYYVLQYYNNVWNWVNIADTKIIYERLVQIFDEVDLMNTLNKCMLLRDTTDKFELLPLKKVFTVAF